MTLKKKFSSIGIVGATGAVGAEVFKLLGERSFPLDRLRAFASVRSEGKAIATPIGTFTAETLRDGSLEGLDLVFLDASDPVSLEWVPKLARAGAYVIDSSGAFRMDPEVPLVVPEVNGHLIEKQVALSRQESASWKRRLFAGPNCSTVQLMLVLHPLHRSFGLKRVGVSTYQSVSGAGTLAIQRLKDEAQAQLMGGPLSSSDLFAHPIAFNCIPHIGSFQESGPLAGYTSEEIKLMEESKKILGLPDLKIAATAVRVPTLVSHCEAVTVDFERPFELESVLSLLKSSPGVCLKDDPRNKLYPMPRDAQGRDEVFVGRVRRDPSADSALSLWIVSDNLRKGAALNAIQVGEEVLRCLSRS